MPPNCIYHKHKLPVNLTPEQLLQSLELGFIITKDDGKILEILEVSDDTVYIFNYPDFKHLICRLADNDVVVSSRIHINKLQYDIHQAVTTLIKQRKFSPDTE